LSFEILQGPNFSGEFNIQLAGLLRDRDFDIIDLKGDSPGEWRHDIGEESCTRNQGFCDGHACWVHKVVLSAQSM